jgi:hypothetical protein
MSGHIPTDPELDLAERQFEYWAQAADDEPHPLLRRMMYEIAADAVRLINAARADADDILYDYDDGTGH